jgi:hypothetical protein
MSSNVGAFSLWSPPNILRPRPARSICPALGQAVEKALRGRVSRSFPVSGSYTQRTPRFPIGRLARCPFGKSDPGFRYLDQRQFVTSVALPLGNEQALGSVAPVARRQLGRRDPHCVWLKCAPGHAARPLCLRSLADCCSFDNERALPSPLQKPLLSTTSERFVAKATI